MGAESYVVPHLSVVGVDNRMDCWGGQQLGVILILLIGISHNPSFLFRINFNIDFLFLKGNICFFFKESY